MGDIKDFKIASFHRVRPFIGIFGVFFLILVASLLFMTPQSAHAGGAAGGSGSGGGGPGGAHSYYGYGWYKFPTNGFGINGRPGGMRSGNWNNVQAACTGVGANTITAFIIMTPTRTVPTSIVYDYADQAHNPRNYYATYPRYLGDNGGSWQNYSQAQAGWNTLVATDPSAASGLTYALNVSWFCSDFQPRGWDISVAISVDKTTALPGTTITWTHSVTNNGPATTAGIQYGYGSNPGAFGPTAIGNGGTIVSTSTYTVTQNDVGKSVCRETIAAPKSSADSGSISTGQACVTVPYDYALTPTMTLNRSNGSVGTTVGLTPRVTNAGPTQSRATDWQVTQFVVSPNQAVPNNAGGVSPIAPCAYFVTNVTACTSPYNGDNGSGAVFGLGVNTLAGTTYTVTDLPVGTHICFAISVKPNSSSSNDYYHSAPACIVVSKSPLVHILGGDLRVGAAFTGNTTPVSSNIDTSVIIKTGKSYGSWDEYGLLASGSITGAGSGSAYSGGLDCSISCATSNLSFSNTPATGGFVPTTNIPDVAATFPVTSATPVFTNLADAAQRRVETATGNITIAGGTIAKGQWLVINAPTSTVTITGDINYDTAPLSSIFDIPQLVIIANQINIEGNVKNVDAWLVASGATGSINTCTQSGATPITPTTQLTSNLCNNLLVINGPLMAKKVYLQRTAGADAQTGSDNPAEVINLRPDAYLWGAYRASQSARLDTTATQELPPRF